MFGDVLEDGYHTNRCALLIIRDLAMLVQPAFVPIGPSNAVLIIDIAPMGKCLTVLLFEALAFIGIHHICDGPLVDDRAVWNPKDFIQFIGTG